jgi:hypothetical protein
MDAPEEYVAAFRRIFPEATDAQLISAIEVIYRAIQDLMGLDEVRHRFGLKKSTANMRVWRHSNLLPQPTVRLAERQLWFRPDVEAFIAANPHAVHDNDLEEVG